MKKLQITLSLALISVFGFAQNINGTWSGTAKAGEKDVVFVFEIESTNDVMSTEMSVPTMRVKGLKPQNTTFENGKLFVDGSNLGMKYEGIYNEVTDKIEGKYTEGAAVLDLVLSKGEVMYKETLNRPQEPTKPYPYNEEEVVFENKKAGITLSGTLTLPQENVEGGFPVVVLISGSGPQDRNETFATHKPFLVLADYLTRQGIAVLRYDDRGVGESTGSHDVATTADFATDVLGAVEFLRTRTEINPKKIGLIGHSEGGIIAPLAVNQTEDVAFMVLWASTGIPGSELSLMQSKTLRPFPVEDEDAYEVGVKKAIQIASSDDTSEVRKEKLTEQYNSFLAPVLKSLGAPDDKIVEIIAGEVNRSIKPWSHYFLNYNPADEIEKITIPVLSLNGSKDTQVVAGVNQDGIRNALIKAKNKDYKVLELPNLNHMFQECKTGAISEYSKIEQTISPVALEEISGWILEHVK